ncbi:uncharacterized protein VP01_1213g2 [Puccinia sorghi]|uniref:Uncharacterized protein n=1 Tax=Puccinia sorghi TaxID=27349 RepID=A0A0L6VRQ2_9BASI|nr:uncharacterized protein VP01_1213g2 [Puccinia sorghi]
MNQLSIQRNQSGQTFSKIFYGVLKQYNLCDRVHTIKANNTSENTKMARELQSNLTSLEPKKNSSLDVLHNLGAKAELAVLDSLEDEDCHPISMTEIDDKALAISISNLTLEPALT